MALFTPLASKQTLLGRMLAGNNTVLKLFVNNITPSSTDTAATYTEMSTNGYSAKTLTAGSWSVGTSGSSAEATYAAQTFSFTAGTPTTVYGYYIVDATTGNLLWAERFATSDVVQYTGDQITITPLIDLA